MPRYKNMVCWVTPETKKGILEIAEDLPIVFTEQL